MVKFQTNVLMLNYSILSTLHWKKFEISIKFNVTVEIGAISGFRNGP